MIEQLDTHPDYEAFKDYMGRFEICSMTRKDDGDDKIIAHSLTFIRKVAKSSLNIFQLSIQLSKNYY